MTLQELLASLLNPSGQGQAAPQMGGAPAQVGDHNNPALLMQAQQRLAQPPQMPQQAPQQQAMPQQAPQGQPMPQASPQAPQPQGGGLGNALGGILQNIITPQAAQKNKTVGWLQTQGLDQGTATVLASDKGALRSYILQRSQSKGPTEFDQRAAAAEQYGLKRGTPEFNDYVLGRKPEGDSLQSVGKDSVLYDKKTKTWITPPKVAGGQDGYQILTPEEVAAQGLPPGQYQKSPDGKIDPVLSASSSEFAQAQDVRKEIQALPSYKNFAQAAPIYATMVDSSSRDTKAADLNLVYSLGKIFDPNSVVREGEMVMVKDTAALPDWLVGSINSLNGGARLQPETRKAMLKEARSRIDAYKSMLDNDLTQYQGIAQHFKIDPKYLLPPLPKIADVPSISFDGSLPLPPPDAGAPVAPAAPAAPTGPSPQRFGYPAGDPTQGVTDWQDWFKKKGR